MLPPGKNCGETTKLSVDMALRPLAGSAAALKKTYPALHWREGRLLNRADEKSIRNWVDNCKL